MKSPRLCMAVILALAFAGCTQKPAEEAAKSETPAAEAPPKAAGEAPRRAPHREAPPKPVAVTVPTGTAFEVRLITGLSSKDNNAGDAFSGTLENPVAVEGKTVIPKGAEVTGKVTNAVPSGRLKQRAELWVTLTSVEVRGKRYDVVTSTAGHKEGSKTTRDILFIGGGAGAGAAIGGATGGGKGAGIGAAIGAGAGTAAAMLTGQRDVKFPPETLLRFQLEQELKVQP